MEAVNFSAGVFQISNSRGISEFVFDLFGIVLPRVIKFYPQVIVIFTVKSEVVIAGNYHLKRQRSEYLLQKYDTWLHRLLNLFLFICIHSFFLYLLQYSLLLLSLLFNKFIIKVIIDVKKYVFSYLFFS